VDSHEHESFIKTPQQLVVVILLAFLVPIIGIILLVQLVIATSGTDPKALAPELVAERIKPVAKLEFGPREGAPAPAGQPAAKPAAQAKAGAADGKAVYEKTCFACHAQSVAGSPKIGDKAAWAPRIKQGMDTLVQSVLKGKGAMPPKAGNPSLSDAEIRAAVEFMTSQSK
jgi:cytochrome c5